MGFGPLLCGYFTLAILPFGAGPYRFLPYSVGALVAAHAVLALREYEPAFGRLAYPLSGYGLLSVFQMIEALDDAFLWGLPVHGAVLTDVVVPSLTFATDLSLTILTLAAARRVARAAGLPKLVSRANFNLSMTVLWAVGQPALLLFPSAAAARGGLATKLLLLWVLLLGVLNCLLLYSCFRLICPAGSREAEGTEAPPEDPPDRRSGRSRGGRS